MTTENRKLSFKDAYELPIGKHVAKKNNFEYLSWSFAIKHLRENFPAATWMVHEDSGFPFFNTPLGYMVKVSVFVEGNEYAQWMPVLDYRNEPMETPTTFDINSSIQRCLVKAIGLATGIGLALYAGDNIPTEQEVVKAITDEQVVKIKDFLEDDRCDEKLLLTWAGVDNVEEIPAAKFDLAVAGLAKRVME